MAAMNSAKKAIPQVAARPIDGEEIIDEREFCKRLSVSCMTAHNWRQSGKVPYLKLPWQDRALSLGQRIPYGRSE